ncbi:unnamed protein product [Aureobasidium pullulans]|nr:unnamed protein product [Aureobasidium pullulans]
MPLHPGFNTFFACFDSILCSSRTPTDHSSTSKDLQTSAYTLFATHKPSAEAVSRGKAPDFTGILLTLIRLESQQTDLVISVNVPHVGGDYNKDDVDPSAGKQGPMLDAATSFRDRILQTFEIKDWDLFVQE